MKRNELGIQESPNVNTGTWSVGVKNFLMKETFDYAKERVANRREKEIYL